MPTPDGISIIIPAYNCQQAIAPTLNSIEESILYFQNTYRHAAEVAIEVCIVNDAATDQTCDIIQHLIQDKSHYRLIHHTYNQGAAAARNTGVRLSNGEILFFCDGDDRFLKEHLYIGYKALIHEIGIQPDQRMVLIPEKGNLSLPPIDSSIGILKTKIRLQDQIHPHWKDAIANSIPSNLVLRRACHEFVEGFPEHGIYRQVGREDTAYMRWLGKFFQILRADIETVEYLRYPGNSFDRQLKKFQTPPENYVSDWSEAEQELHKLAFQQDDAHLNYLYQKLLQLDDKYIPKPWINWSSLITEALNNKQESEAVHYCDRSSHALEKLTPEQQQQLAKAYNNLGVQRHNQGQLEQATHYLERALAIAASLPANEQAKIYLNLGSLRIAQGTTSQAIAALETALHRDPALTQAQAELTKVYYHHAAQDKGYQFTRDWFSHNIPIWEMHLRPFAHQPDLQFLEIGSWEGRSTCWLLDYILTHDTAQITCIDPFEGSVEHQDYNTEYLQSLEARFDHNIHQTGAAHKVLKRVGYSQEILRSLPLEHYDLLYIDGSHLAVDVLEDALMGWRLVKPGGIIIFDDYGFSFGKDQNPNQNPKAAIDPFLQVFCDKIKILHQGYQVLLKKRVS